ncbi:hypothetical protein [Priestia taiwanensis]|uniref:Pilus assembly protein, PilO n=1 Tax=Priestia taiwanensis TaxID=1347902 RepID=A0A917ESS4_9BACI|nr:hypothetical protein [Priestia taiwanensis]MBM7363600.1 type IV pilus assembly protein PilO [Priestia taiwanensis]GGE75731.1 hypothetical protein GCM10007140_26890 [Priestia taiwanensis]
MKIAVTKKIVVISLLLFVMLSGASIGAYYLYIKPVQAEHEQAKQSLQAERQLLEQTKKRVEELRVNPTVSSAVLQYKVPIQPLTEQIVLFIEKAEVMSRSKVKSITFEEGIEGIENAKKVTLDVKVSFETYEKMQYFLELLQNQKRIIHVDALAFSWKDEMEQPLQERRGQVEGANVEKKTESTYSVKISAFYAADLQGLEDGLPKVDIPKGSKKTNPLTVQ